MRVDWESPQNGIHHRRRVSSTEGLLSRRVNFASGWVSRGIRVVQMEIYPGSSRPSAEAGRFVGQTFCHIFMTDLDRSATRCSCPLRGRAAARSLGQCSDVAAQNSMRVPMIGIRVASPRNPIPAGRQVTSVTLRCLVRLKMST